MDLITVYQIEFKSLTVAELLIYVAIGVLVKVLIRTSGPVVLHGRYHKAIDYYSYNDASRLNIFYRILAPVVFAYLLLFSINFVLSTLKLPSLENLYWLPIVVYWICQSITVLRARQINYPKWTLLAQAFISVGTGIYFDWVVVREIPVRGISWFEQTNIGWQFLLIFFFGASGLILSGFVKNSNRYQQKVSDLDPDSDDNLVTLRLRFSPKEEAKLYSFQRRFQNLLPQRFNEDPLLGSLFYSIMYIEDANRPAWRRALEKMLFFTGRVRSTGIMQVRSDHYLSDEDSVQKAIPKIERIWLEFLENIAQRSHWTVVISPEGYGYDFAIFREEFLKRSGLLYGRYCGTMTHEVAATFAAVTDFFIYSKNSLPPINVWVRADSFSEYSKYFPDQRADFSANAMSNPFATPEETESELVLRNFTQPSNDEVRRVVGALRKLGCSINKVTLVGDAQTEIRISFPNGQIRHEIRETFDQWKIETVHY